MKPLFPLLLTAALSAAIASATPPTLAEQIDDLATQKKVTQTRTNLIRQAEKDAAKPVIRRPMSLADILADPQATTKYNEKPAHQKHLTEEEWQRFALSLGDTNINGQLATRLPRMAAAYRFTNDRKILDAILAQLTETATWQPLERPGAVSTRANISPAPWLGSGWGVRAIADTLEILPPESIPASLKTSLDSLLESEIRDVRTAWKQNRLWYTREASAFSNQWIVPTEGLIRASLRLGKEKHADDYEFGIKNLLLSLDMQGNNGEFAEGFSYASLTLNSLLSVADAAARSGDRRLLDHPFFKHFPTWYVHHLQPGPEMINAFDSKGIELDRVLLARLVSITGSPEAWWAAKSRFKGHFGSSLSGLLGQNASFSVTPKEPPLFAKYDVAARINWRDSWDDGTAAGFWMRGGHESDSHDHMDRGHVSFSIGKRKLLIEAGLYSYGVPQHPTHYKSVAGHNVLQIGSQEPAKLNAAALKTAGQILSPAHRSAPITVERMDETGGVASVDMSGCYTQAGRWVRKVTWNRKGVEVLDEVELKSPETITFRWHLATPADTPADIRGHQVTSGDTVVSLQPSEPVDLSVVPMPHYESSTKNEAHHSCVVVRSSSKVTTFTLTSKIRFKD